MPFPQHDPTLLGFRFVFKAKTFSPNNLQSMNLREMKIALTVDLMNLPGSPATIASVQNAVSRNHPEAGMFMGSTESRSTYIGEGLEGKSVALHFENITLDLDLISNSYSDEQVIKGFDLKGNYA
jgi:hypothetical protein